MDSFCDGARSFSWWRGKDKNHIWVDSAWQDEWADVVANHSFFFHFVFLRSSLGTRAENVLERSATLWLPRQCLDFAMKFVRHKLGDWSRSKCWITWTLARRSVTWYALCCFAYFVQQSKKACLSAMRQKTFETSLAYFEATYSWAVKRSDLLFFVLPFCFSLPRVLQKM